MHKPQLKPCSYLGIVLFTAFSLYPLVNTAQGDVAAGKKLAATCASCHGENGLSGNEAWPNLAGQKSTYLIKQIKAFRDGSRSDPSMSAMVATLKDDEIENIAAYFSSFKLSLNANEPKKTITLPAIQKQVSAKVGGEIYAQNCVFCHQADAIGKPGLAPSLTNKELLSHASDTFFFGTIHDGRANTGMPPFAHLGQDSILSIIAFLRDHTTEPSDSYEIDKQPFAKGDPELGAELFQQICSTCHGDKGSGYIAGGTGTAIGKEGFLSKATDGFIRTTIKQGRSNTRMLGFQGPEGLANLDDHEIDSIIVYLRSLPQSN